MYKLFHFHAVDPRGFIPSERNDKALLPFHDLGMNVHGSLLRHANVNDRAGLPRNVVLVRVGGVCRLMRQLLLQQELAHQAANAADTDEDDVPWETGTVIDVRMPQERAVNVHTEVVEGQKCLVIPLTGDESARINGVEVE